MLQAVHIGDEPGEATVEIPGERQVVDDRTGGLGKALAGHDQWDARRIGHQHHGSDASLQLIDRHRLDIAAHQVVIGIGGFHRHLRQHRVHALEVLGGGIAPIAGMQLVAQVLQAHALVALRVLAGDAGQATGQAGVGVVAALELQQLGEQGAPLALGNAHGEQHQERIQAGLLHHQPTLPEELADHRRRNPVLAQGPSRGQPRHDQGHLDRVEQHVVIGDTGKAVPLALGLQQPVGGAYLVDALDPLRLPDREPPVIGGDVLPQVGQGAAEAQGLVEHFLQQRAAGRAFHHGRGHVQRSHDAVLRGRGGVHHEGFVEAVTIQLPAPTVLHMDHRRLAEGGQQLVGRVGGEHQRAIGRTRGAHAVAPSEKLVERRIGVPGLVEVQHLDAVAQALLDQLGVVAQAVVGGVGDHRQLDLGCPATGQRTGVDLGLDRLDAELAQRDRADDSQFVALRAQVQRDRPGHDD